MEQEHGHTVDQGVDNGAVGSTEMDSSAVNVSLVLEVNLCPVLILSLLGCTQSHLPPPRSLANVPDQGT
jgi:hypothetical protein